MILQNKQFLPHCVLFEIHFFLSFWKMSWNTFLHRLLEYLRDVLYGEEKILFVGLDSQRITGSKTRKWVFIIISPRCFQNGNVSFKYVKKKGGPFFFYYRPYKNPAVAPLRVQHERNQRHRCQEFEKSN